MGDLHVDVVAVLQCAEPLVVGAHVQHVTWPHGRDRRGPRNRLRDTVREVAGTVVGAELATHPELHVQLLGVADLVASGNARTEWREAVVRFVPGHWHPRPVDATAATARRR